MLVADALKSISVLGAYVQIKPRDQSLLSVSSNVEMLGNLDTSMKFSTLLVLCRPNCLH